MSRVAVYTGSFDPLTFGHLDIIRRAARLADRLVIGVSTNSTKAPLLPLDVRVALIAAEAAAIGAGVEVQPFTGLAVDFAGALGAQLIVRGLRSGADFHYEQPMAAMNAHMAPAVETLFLAAAPALAPVSSTLVKDVARAGGRIELFVPAAVADAIRAAVPLHR